MHLFHRCNATQTYIKTYSFYTMSNKSMGRKQQINFLPKITCAVKCLSKTEDLEPIKDEVRSFLFLLIFVFVCLFVLHNLVFVHLDVLYILYIII